MIIEAERACYAIRGQTIVDNVSLSIDKGELVVILGPNGAGKTTLLRMLTGEYKPTSGVARLGGVAIGEMAPVALARRRAVMTQASHLMFPYSVLEVISFGLHAANQQSPQAATAIERSIDLGDVRHLIDRNYQTLSGGEQQRVQFARAICQILACREAGSDQALFLDEPTSNLDLKHQIMIMSAARTLCREGVAVCAVLHDINLAAACADRIVMMKKGRVERVARPAEAITHATIREIFDIDLTVLSADARGRPYIVPDYGSIERL
ncbi:MULTISPECIES: heme ABC transporter ATP-binding protein [unclassified Beijerinckia]|uniref:heme ABC transporter ATP-binding protein n=1 Tax=unclassified Beijerinckia TaxID=2638183 RepID=UPI000899EFC9|nr:MULTISPECIES: heme ABC transporter ATP-binding protein [unclassified Beijerinckia]MDH7795048.1 iron complex transport system ATP-binding protein [Beijerinckia sp. GAS462]SEB85457.1 iron complex transport system ATP-binding protein [Beijerinckia sp. 28-YEA-48]